MEVYPLLLTPRLFPRIWGGEYVRSIVAPNAELPLPLGEVWAVHGELQVCNGAYAGQSLDDLWRKFPQEMGGGKNAIVAGRKAAEDASVADASADGASADGASADGASADGASADGASADGASADGASAADASADGASAADASADGASADGASAEGASVAEGASAEGALAEFPILIKWLDTNDWLSVQVHPDDVQARAIEGDPQASGKVECWYVVAVRGEGELICGCREESDVAEIARLSGRDLLPHLHFQRVQCGDFLFVPPGTIHALGPGITVLEVQQRSSITYRFYDWDRPAKPGVVRRLHLPQARQAWMQSSRLALHGGRHPQLSLGKLLTANAFFAQELVDLSSELGWQYTGLEIVIALDKELEVTLGGVTVKVAPFGVAVLPAAGGQVNLTCADKAHFMRVMCPLQN